MEAVEVTDNDPASVLLSLLLVATVEAMEVVVELVKCLPPPEEDDRRTGGGGLVTSGGSSGSPSQSRRFYKCLGCGAAKRWDRLTDHYRKVRQGRTLDGSG